MSMSKILILGMFKDKSGYKVIGFIMSTMKFCKFDLKDICNRKVIAWDVGAITEVESFKKIDESTIKVMGDCVLQRHFDKKELKEFLISKKVDFKEFTKKANIRYCAIKVNTIRKIYNKYNKFYIELTCEGIVRSIQIKDARWIEYWNHLLNKKDDKLVIEKEDYYREFLNNRETYFIICKDFLEDRNSNSRFKKDMSYISVAGIFWF